MIDLTLSDWLFGIYGLIILLTSIISWANIMSISQKDIFLISSLDSILSLNISLLSNDAFTDCIENIINISS